MNSSKSTLDSISAKIRLNMPLSPAEVALYTGVTPKTVTAVWIAQKELGASKLGSRTILIEPNALRVWLINKRVKVRISKIKKPSVIPPSGESSLTAEVKITENSILSRGNYA